MLKTFFGSKKGSVAPSDSTSKVAPIDIKRRNTLGPLTFSTKLTPDEIDSAQTYDSRPQTVDVTERMPIELKERASLLKQALKNAYAPLLKEYGQNKPDDEVLRQFIKTSVIPMINSIKSRLVDLEFRETDISILIFCIIFLERNNQHRDYNDKKDTSVGNTIGKRNKVSTFTYHSSLDDVFTGDESLQRMYSNLSLFYISVMDGGTSNLDTNLLKIYDACKIENKDFTKFLTKGVYSKSNELFIGGKRRKTSSKTKKRNKKKKSRKNKKGKRVRYI
jgi:hypothetical protein